MLNTRFNSKQKKKKITIILVHLNDIFPPALWGVTRRTIAVGGCISFSISRVLILQTKDYMVWIFFSAVLISIIPVII